MIKFIGRDIESAPIGTVVLTDLGTGICYSEDGQWYLCDTFSNVPTCADWGLEISEITPTKWIPMPDF
ncbi:MAG: hypothetical protein HRT61_01180 [Ekhidna sp.]|nr:hypothetical protein [Ekhidna sp.]